MKKNEKKEFYNIIENILNHEEFQKRKDFPHHGEESVYDHSLKVAFLSYTIAKKLHLDEKSTAIGALLHDFYTTPWQDSPKKKKFNEMHGFIHAKEAYHNAKKYFPELITPKIKDIIIKHMFPLNIKPPRYRESWVVTLSDKIVSMSIFKNPKDLPKYVGINRKKKVKK